MPDTAEMLRVALHAAVDDLSPSPGLEDVVRRRLGQRTRRRRLAAVGAAVSAAAAAVVVAVVSPGGGDAPEVVAGPGAPGEDVLYLVPEHVPRGLSLVGVTGGDQPGVGEVVTVDPDWTGTQRYVRFDESDARPAEVVDVQWGPVPAGDDPLAGYRESPPRGPVTVRGHDGLASDDGGWLVWEEPPGTLVRVTGEVAAPGDRDAEASTTPLGRDLLVAFGEAMTWGDDGRPEVAEPPGGFEVVAEWPGTASTGTNPRAVTYAADDGRALQVHVVDDSELPPGINLRVSDARRVGVAGNGAVLTPYLLLGSEQTADLFVQWVEPGGEQVTVSGVGLDEDELLASAGSLAAVDAETWAVLMGEGEGDAAPDDGPAPTDATPQNPTTAPAASASGDEPPAGAVRVAGSYTGTEHFGFTDGDCPDLDHVLDATFVLDDGTEWQFHTEYCGALDDTTWSSTSGTFTFTTPDGSTITGTKEVEPLQIPSGGEPQPLVITGGTGAYAGASGSCDLEVVLTPVQLGVQEHEGDFTCDITT